MNKLEQAARQALGALVRAEAMYGQPNADIQTALREALAEQVHTPYCKQAPMCKTPCGNSDCVEQAEQEPFDMDDHPPHRLCECRKCMEYFTPLPDCDAFAASGKPIAEQEPVAEVVSYHEAGLYDELPIGTLLYAAPVRTKDLTDEEITNEWESMGRGLGKYTEFAHAVIAADREKNNANNNS